MHDRTLLGVIILVFAVSGAYVLYRHKTGDKEADPPVLLRLGLFALGKGAYQVGAMLTLRELGITRFAGIAGTSVGALNGALIAQGGLADAEEIWRAMAPGRVLSLSVKFPFAAIGRLLIVPFYLLGGAKRPWDHLRYYLDSHQSIAALVDILVKFVGGAVILGVLVLFSSWEQVTALGFPYGLFQDAYVALGALYLAASWYVLDDMHGFLADKVSLLSNRPLQKLVNERLRVEQIQSSPIPVYVTHASLALVLTRRERTAEEIAASIAERDKILAEPDKGCDPDFGVSRLSGVNVEPYVIERTLGFQPHYADLRSEMAYAIREFVLQSAGLPEIFPRRRVKGKDVIDGGLADNGPYLPLLREPGIDRLIVIYLEPKDLGKERERLTRLASQRYVDLWSTEKVEAAIRSELSAQAPREIKTVGVLPIILSRSLGGLLFGTMNFSGNKSEALIRLGQWDALSAIERGLEVQEF